MKEWGEKDVYKRQDENILLADKRPGMVVHADETEKVNTLINHIQAYLCLLYTSSLPLSPAFQSFLEAQREACEGNR